jgi:pyruvate oxidase
MSEELSSGSNPIDQLTPLLEVSYPAAMSESTSEQWHRVLDADDLPEGRVTTVTVGRRSLAVSHHEGRYGAIDNRCPH